VTAHTTNCDEVEYYDEDSGEGNEDVLTCKSMGCTKKKRKAATGAKQPVKKKKVSHVFGCLLLFIDHSSCAGELIACK
jgi:hypothetical protein